MIIQSYFERMVDNKIDLIIDVKKVADGFAFGVATDLI
jgi:hypothetical protein